MAPTFEEAGAIAARVLMTTYGHPDSMTWFQRNAPDPNDADAISSSGKPVEFWRAAHDEIMSVGGTA